MFKGRRILVVVPARGGSKGVTLKNIHPLRGVPLIAHTGNLIRELGYVDRAVVSTDHPDIAEVAARAGIEVPFMRPLELSGDRIGDFPVLQHAVTEVERLESVQYDVVVMLQPTSPLRKPAHVTSAITKLIDEEWDAVWTVSLTDLKCHPMKQLTISASGELNYYAPEGAMIVARQQLPPVYHRNGAAYAYARECLLVRRSTMGGRAAAIVIEEPMISIDTLTDFDRVERYLAASSEANQSSKG